MSVSSSLASSPVSDSRYEANVHTANCVYLIVLDFGEYELLFDTHSIVASAVERVAVDSSEVTNSRKSEIEESVHKLKHSVASERNLNANRHALTELEVCD